MTRFEKTGCLRHASRFAHGSLYSGGGLDIYRTTKPLSDCTPRNLDGEMTDRERVCCGQNLKEVLGLEFELQGWQQVTFPLGLGQVDRDLVHFSFTRLSGTNCYPLPRWRTSCLSLPLNSPPCHPTTLPISLAFIFSNDSPIVAIERRGRSQS